MDMFSGDEDNVTGFEKTEETIFRSRIISFVQELGKRVLLPSVPICSACVFCHKFLEKENFRNYNPDELGIAFVFIAGKVEESIKFIKKILHQYYILKNTHNPHFNPDTFNFDSMYTSDGNIISLKRQIFNLELKILDVLNFEMTNEFPFAILTKYIHKVQMHREIAKHMWSAVVAAYSWAPIVLNYSVNDIAATSVFLTYKMCQQSCDKDWLSFFNVNIATVEGCLKEFMNFFAFFAKYRSSNTSIPKTPSPTSGAVMTNFNHHLTVSTMLGAPSVLAVPGVGAQSLLGAGGVGGIGGMGGGGFGNSSSNTNSIDCGRGGFGSSSSDIYGGKKNTFM